MLLADLALQLDDPALRLSQLRRTLGTMLPRQKRYLRWPSGLAWKSLLSMTPNLISPPV
jgi:hypothetical protein